MAHRSALLVGLKQVDPTTHTSGWNASNGTEGSELDVDNMARLLIPLGFRVKTLKTSEATHHAILQALREAAQTTKPGELFVFYYSGHGGQQPDFKSTNIDEGDGKDETLVAYDKDIIDDDLNDIWCSFAEGAGIFMISDSCNSGTLYKGFRDFRALTPVMPVIDPLVNNKMRAQLIHFGGCLDGSNAEGHRDGGLFTMALCRVWNNGAFQGNYRTLLESTIPMIDMIQKPQYHEFGPVTDRFRNARPFEVG